MKRLILLIVCLMVAWSFIFTSQSFGASITTSWDAPVTNEDACAITGGMANTCPNITQADCEAQGGTFIPGTPLEDLDHYNVKIGVASGVYDNTHSTSGLETTYTLIGLAASTTYYIAVTSVDTTGNESCDSQELSITTIAPPAPTKPTNIQGTEVPDGIAHYLIDGDVVITGSLDVHGGFIN